MAKIILILIIKHYLHLRAVLVAIVIKFTFAILLFVFRTSPLFFILFSRDCLLLCQIFFSISFSFLRFCYYLYYSLFMLFLSHYWNLERKRIPDPQTCNHPKKICHWSNNKKQNKTKKPTSYLKKGDNPPPAPGPSQGHRISNGQLTEHNGRGEKRPVPESHPGLSSICWGGSQMETPLPPPPPLGKANLSGPELWSQRNRLLRLSFASY